MQLGLGGAGVWSANNAGGRPPAGAAGYSYSWQWCHTPQNWKVIKVYEYLAGALGDVHSGAVKEAWAALQSTVVLPCT